MQGLTQVTTDLSEIVGNEHVQMDPMIISRYDVDGAMPGAVVFPRDPQQVSQVVTYASQKGLALLPWGSGSKMGEGNPPKRIDLVVCTSRLARSTVVTLSCGSGFQFSISSPLEAKITVPSSWRCIRMT